MYLCFIGFNTFLLGICNEMGKYISLNKVALQGLPIFVLLQFITMLVRVLVCKLIGICHIDTLVVIGRIERSISAYKYIGHDTSTTTNDASTLGVIAGGIRKMDRVGREELTMLKTVQ